MKLSLGFIPLNDCAALAVAQERGLFTQEGLQVSLSREASWASLRDRVGAGLLQGAHMLAPMTLAANLGLGGERIPLAAPFALNLNGSAFTVSRPVAAALRAVSGDQRPGAGAVKTLADARRERGEAPLTFAVVFPFSMHNYQLRDWLASGGVHPDRDVRLKVAPPPRMVEQLAAGEIDGFCVGAPWNAAAVEQGVGEILLHGSSWWGAGPDKVLGLSAGFVEEHPDAVRALLRALIQAAQWADDPDNHDALSNILASPNYVGAPWQAVRQSLGQAPPFAQGEPAPPTPDYLVFHRYAAGFPWKSHAMWFLSQMVRWGQAAETLDFAAGAAAYRPDLYRLAAADLGVAAPAIDAKPEGAHTAPWMLTEASAPLPMPADSWSDGRVFDPMRPLEHALSAAIRR